ncbi:hypothetical protein MSSD1_80 [Mycoplasmopsis synoviae]|nr:hypothetical protein MSHv_05380 [Mycoplasmopsis synoviae]AQU48335.1 hypothetical protein ADF19_05380 [Mycoplasmopsis synoviae]
MQIKITKVIAIIFQYFFFKKNKLIKNKIKPETKKYKFLFSKNNNKKPIVKNKIK